MIVFAHTRSAYRDDPLVAESMTCLYCGGKVSRQYVSQIGPIAMCDRPDCRVCILELRALLSRQWVTRFNAWATERNAKFEAGKLTAAKIDE